MQSGVYVHLSDQSNQENKSSSEQIRTVKQPLARGAGFFVNLPRVLYEEIGRYSEGKESAAVKICSKKTYGNSNLKYEDLYRDKTIKFFEKVNDKREEMTAKLDKFACGTTDRCLVTSCCCWPCVIGGSVFCIGIFITEKVVGGIAIISAGGIGKGRDIYYQIKPDIGVQVKKSPPPQNML